MKKVKVMIESMNTRGVLVIFRICKKCNMYLNRIIKESFDFLHQRRARNVEVVALQRICSSDYSFTCGALSLDHCELVKCSG